MARAQQLWMASAAIIVLTAGACAQTPAQLASQTGVAPLAAQQAELDRMLSAPADHENTFAYVRASVAARDYEAAIAALERILDYNPNLTRARFELGTLYFRLGSFAMAAQLFDQCLADPAIDPGLRRRVEAFLPEARKQLSASRWSGTIFSGIRYNSNVSGLPDGGLIRYGGIDVYNNGSIKSLGGASAAVTGDVSHVYDFQTERPLTWETGALGYGALQTRQPSLSTALFEIATGPRFGLTADNLTGISIRPYAVGGSSFVGGATYVSTAGGGISANFPVNPFLSISPGAEVRSINAPFGNLGTLNSGTLVTGSLGARWTPFDRVTVDGRAFFARNGADPYNANSSQGGLAGSVKFDFSPPTETIGLDWSLTAYGRYTGVVFDQPNILIDPLVRRHDQQTRAGLQLDMPFDPNFGVSANVQYTSNYSNQRNFRADAWTAMAGPTLRF